MKKNMGLITTILVFSLFAINSSADLLDLKKKLEQSVKAIKEQNTPTSQPQNSNSEQVLQQPQNSNSEQVSQQPQTYSQSPQKSEQNAVIKSDNSKTSKLNLVSSEEYCQSVLNSPDAQAFVSNIQKIRDLKLIDEEISKMGKQSLNSSDNQLGKYVVSNLNSITKGDRFVFYDVEKIIYKMANDCAAKNYDKPIFLFFAERPADINERPYKDWASELADKFQKNPSAKEFYLGVGLSLKETDVNSRWASIAAFAFPNSSEIIHSSAVKNNEQLAAVTETKNKERESRIAQINNEEDEKQYGGLRAVYKFRKNTIISPAYNKCLASEKNYQTKVTSDIGKEIAKANTVAEQKETTELVNYRKKNIDYISHSMCVYRINVGISSIESDNEIQTVMGGVNFNDRSKDNLENKFTPNATKKIAEWLNIPAETFHKTKIQEPLAKALNDLNSQTTITKAQREQLEAQKMLINLGSPMIYEQIYFKILPGFIAGKIQN